MEECETESGKQILLSQAHVLSSSCLAGSARIAEFTRRWLELSWGRSTDNGRGHCEPRPFHPQTLSLSLIQQPNAAKAGEARNEQGACDSIPPNRSASPSPPYTSRRPHPPSPSLPSAHPFPVLTLSFPLCQTASHPPRNHDRPGRGLVEPRPAWLGCRSSS